MIRFLIALPAGERIWVCYSVVPVGREQEKEENKAIGGIYLDDDSCLTECNHGDKYQEFLENEGYAKPAHVSGLVALDVRPDSARLGWRSIHPRRGHAFCERWL
jgi:hypothetical protein